MDTADHDLLIRISEDIKHIRENAEEERVMFEHRMDSQERTLEAVAKDIRSRLSSSEGRISVLETWHISAKAVYAAAVVAACLAAYVIEGMI